MSSLRVPGLFVAFAALTMVELTLVGLVLRPGQHAPPTPVGSAAQPSAAVTAPTATSPARADAPHPPPGVSTKPYAVAFAYRLRIPALGIDAGVESVGTDGHGRVGVPANIWDAAWYRGGPAPGDPGDAVIDGHLDWYTGPALFAHLDHLRQGELVQILAAGGTILTFRVTALNWYAYTAKPVGFLAPAGPPRLSLVTCGGTWNARAGTYNQRLVVEALLIA